MINRFLEATVLIGSPVGFWQKITLFCCGGGAVDGLIYFPCSEAYAHWLWLQQSPQWGEPDPAYSYFLCLSPF